ncbi:MAG: hypothetical protein RBS57_11365 [Desulforhabdus sp.]|jgi:hypothetical protein|nr:hypothetical protein [Desulforhabdus sp.]
MKILRLLLGIVLGLAGTIEFVNSPLLGLSIALLGGAMVLDAAFALK